MVGAATDRVVLSDPGDVAAVSGVGMDKKVAIHA